MIPLIAEVPDVAAQAEEATSSKPGDVHLTCCRPNVALCGEDLTGGVDEADGTPVDCIRCEFIDEAELPCGAPFCRVRSAWRAWRSS